MAAPWRELTGWAKSVAVSATMLVVSLGLCGLNYGTLFAVANHTSAGAQQQWANILFITAFLEVGGMAFGAAGLLVSLTGLAIESMRRKS